MVVQASRDEVAAGDEALPATFQAPDGLDVQAAVRLVVEAGFLQQGNPALKVLGQSERPAFAPVGAP